MPEVKMRMRDLVNRFRSIERLREAPKVRAKLAFELALLAGQTTAVIRAFEEARAKVVKEFSEDDGKGQKVVPPEKMDEFTGQMDELLDREVVINAEPVGIPANFEMDGLVGAVADWSEFLVLKE